MRRLAAVFSGKRSDKSDAGSSASHAPSSSSKTLAVPAPAKSRPGFFRSLSKGSSSVPDFKNKKHAMPPVSTVPDHAGSSASSSSGGPRTPSDDHDSLVRGIHGNVRKGGISLLSDKALPKPPRPYIPLAHHQDPDTDVSSEVDSVDEQEPRRSLTKQPMSPLPPLSPAAHFRAITEKALQPPFSPPPLLHVAHSPLFPRSCNPAHELSPSDSLRARMHRTRLLRRLGSTPERVLAGFANRTLPPRHPSLVLDDVAIHKSWKVSSISQGLRQWTDRPCFEDRLLVYLPDGDGGVQCERVSASAAVEAIAYSDAVEFMAGFYEDLVPEQVESAQHTSAPTIPLPPTNSSTGSLTSIAPSPSLTGSTSSLPATNTKLFPNGALPFCDYCSSAYGRPAAYKSAPSPLRIGSNDSVPETASTKFITTSQQAARRPESVSPVSSSQVATSPIASVKPAVRFAEDDKEDSIPLEYVMRHKRAREQKKQFLAQERARRLSTQAPVVPRPSSVRSASIGVPCDDPRLIADERRKLEEQRRRQEEEQRKHEEERKKFERERAAWERERQAAEEERKKRMYADELAEARRRREKTRQGTIPKEGYVAWEGDREKEREAKESESRPAYSRPRYDSHTRRGSSESPSSSRLNVPHPDSSPGSSRPPSVGGGSARGSSRPPSMYSTPPSSASATDIRTRRESKASRRTSFVSEGGAFSPQQMFVPGGSPGGFPWGPVPPVPAMPMGINMMPMGMQMPMQMQMPVMPYVTDMPLLPPTPPFMMQQYGPRGHGQRSHSSSPTRGHSSDSDKRRASVTGGASSSRTSHRRTPSDDVSAHAGNRQSSTPPSSSAASLRQSRTPVPIVHSQSYTPSQRPTPVSSWPKQPSFQNLSRPAGERRQTMIT